MKRVLATGVAALLALGLIAPAASAARHHGHSGHSGHQNRRALVFLGALTATSVDSDPSTPDTFTFHMFSGNRAARRWQEAHAGDITVAVTDGTRFRGPLGLGRHAADYRVGDGVRLMARLVGDGLGARAVRLMLQGYQGTLTAFDRTAGTASVDWSHANKLAQYWLAGHGSPDPVSAVLTADSRITREGGGDPIVGDDAKMAARPTADGSGLEAVVLNTVAPGTAD